MHIHALLRIESTGGYKEISTAQAVSSLESGLPYTMLLAHAQF